MADAGSGALRLFAVTAPGLESLAAAELRKLGVAGTVDPGGGVGWEGSMEDLYAASLHLRTASRVVLRMGQFTARSFIELERHARRLPWESFLAPGRAVRWRVSCRKSRLYHEGAVAQRFQAAVERAIGPVAAASAGEEEDAGELEQLFVVRFLRDRCTVSVDGSGALLHRRGYRQAVAKAPLRETLAAALLLASGWDTPAPLLDPLCGSGTIPIEGALLARRIPPGLASADREPRRYAFEEWPGFDAALWRDVVDRARAGILERSPAPIRGSDRDAGAIAASRANAARAGVEEDVELEVAPLSAAEPAGERGWLVTNPPYGVRVGDAARVRDLYAALGNLARARLPGGTVALLSADPALDRQVGIPLAETITTRNGGIPVRVVIGPVPAREEGTA
jgi:putative N6-adenine-specific DNA methylase